MHPQAVPTSRVGGTHVPPGGTGVPPYPSKSVRNVSSVTGNGREPRTAPPRGTQPEQQTAAAAGRDLAHAIAAKAQKRPPKVSHWTAGTAPQGEANGAYDPAGTAERLAGEPAWEPSPDPEPEEDDHA